MKKPFKLIAIGILAVILVAFLKGGSNDDLVAPANVSEELSQLPAPDSTQERIIDFSVCSPDNSFSLERDLGTNSMKILGLQEDVCLVQTTFTLEGGHYVNDCQVPVSIGSVTFQNGDFDPIAQFCTIKTTGGGLLELQ